MAKSPKSSGDPLSPEAAPQGASDRSKPAPKRAKLSTGKASRPALTPLDTYLADLLSPAVNRERADAAGFAERAQATFAHGDVSDVDPALAKRLGLTGPDDGP